jgi:hypothetical protein
VVDYEVFLPDAVKEGPVSEQAMPLLWGEALSATMGETAKTRAGAQTRAVGIEFVPGRLIAPDNVLGSNVPVGNLKVRFQIGAYISDRYSDSNGYVTLEYPQFNEVPGALNTISLSVIYADKNGRWSIIPGSGQSAYTAPKTTSYTIPAMGQLFPHVEVVLNSSAYQENEIHRAVNYFFNNQSVFNISVPAFGTMQIIANSFSNGGVAG